MPGRDKAEALAASFEGYGDTPYGTHKFLGAGNVQIALLDPYTVSLHKEAAANGLEVEMRAVLKLDRLSSVIIDNLSPEELLQVDMRLAEQMVSREASYNALRRHFGVQRVPQEVFGVSTVYLTKPQMEAAFPNREILTPSQQRTSLRTIVSSQDYVPELESGWSSDLLSVSIRYPEREPAEPDPDMYAALNELLMLQPDTVVSTHELREAFLYGHETTQMRSLLDEAEINTAVNQELQELMRCSISYSLETGYILDFGERNVIMTKQGISKLVDALYPRETPLFRIAGATLCKVAQRQGLKFQEYIDLLNLRRYVCMVNFLAAYTGIEERLHIPGAPDMIGEAWKPVLRDLRRLSTRDSLGKSTAITQHL